MAKRQTKMTSIELDLEVYAQLEAFLAANPSRFKSKRELFTHLILNVDKLLEGNFRSLEALEWARLEVENEKLRLQLANAQEKLQDVATVNDILGRLDKIAQNGESLEKPAKTKKDTYDFPIIGMKEER